MARWIDADALKENIFSYANEPVKLNDRRWNTRCTAIIADMNGIVDNMPTIGGWISVKDRMPESGKPVLVTCEIHSLYGYKKQYVCEAYHAEAHSVSEGKYPEDTDCYDYCEEDDEYYLKEGWYEVIHNWDEYGSIVIGDFVTHWMPLPEPSMEGEAG